MPLWALCYVFKKSVKSDFFLLLFSKTLCFTKMVNYVKINFSKLNLGVKQK